MYVRTTKGLGQPPRLFPFPGTLGEPRRGAAARPRPRAPADLPFFGEMWWFLKVPFRRDFGAFRQEVAKAIDRHTIKNARDITKAEDWILKRKQNEENLHVVHDNYGLFKGVKESEMVLVRSKFTYVRSLIDPHNETSGVEIDKRRYRLLPSGELQELK